MRTVKRIFVSIFIIALMQTFAGCYTISAQDMNAVKGTYKLTQYTYTPKYERKEGYTPRVFNYIEDEEYKYEDYLIVTGTGVGYYVHKEANAPAYAKEITLNYEYDTENSSKVEYVIFNDAITVNQNSGFNKVGITKNSLNYTKNAIDYNELITKRPMRTESYTVRWSKVSRDVDLSYVKELFNEMKEYDYKSFGVRGIYERITPWDSETGVVQDNPYQYFYYVIDTAKNSFSATAYYALKESPTEQVIRKLTLERGEEDWSSFIMDGVTWTIEPFSNSNYSYESEGLKYTVSRVSNEISDERLASIIEVFLP